MNTYITTISLVALAVHCVVLASLSDSSSNTRGFFGGQRPDGYRPVGGPVGGFNAGGVIGGPVGSANPAIGAVSPPIINPSTVGGDVFPSSGRNVCSFWCNRGGQYVCCENSQQAHPGRCPFSRPYCPPDLLRRLHVGWCRHEPCTLDIDCPFHEKCCYDTCRKDRVCKPAFFYQ